MCRIAAYLGPPLSLTSFVLEPPWSLRKQARGPRELPPGTVGADGFGVGWYSPGVLEPARYRAVLLIWGDENFAGLAGHIRAGCALAGIRVAVENMPVGLANTPPYARGRLLLVHNGLLDDFHRSWMPTLRARCGPDELAAIRGNTDSEHVLAVLSTELAGATETAALVDATGRVVEALGSYARAGGLPMSLNLAVSIGGAVVAARYAVNHPAPSLYVATEPTGAQWVASEPLDPSQRWESVAPQSLVTLVAGRPPTHNALS